MKSHFVRVQSLLALHPDLRWFEPFAIVTFGNRRESNLQSNIQALFRDMV